MFLIACLLSLHPFSSAEAPADSLTAAAVPADSAVVVRSVVLTGNYRTRDRIILREMEVHAGDTIRVRDLPAKLAWDSRKISNTNLFVTVDVVAAPHVAIGEPAAPAVQPIDIEVVMKERWYFFAAPTFDLADRNFNEWWYDRGRDLSRTIYGLRASYRNFTGSNDRLALIAEFGFVQRTVLTYSRPYIDKAQRTGLRFDVLHATNREIPYRSEADKLVYFRSDDLLRRRAFAGATLTRRDGFYFFHLLDARYHLNSIADTAARLNPDYFLDGRTRQRYLQLSYTFRYDRRDNVAYPLRGTFLNLTANQLGVLPADDLRQTELIGGLVRFWPLGGRFYASSGIRAKTSWPQRQPYFNLRGMGFSSDFVRGYELYVIDGQHFGLWRNNLRYQLFNVRKQLSWLNVRQFNTLPLAAYIGGFADTGYVRSSVAERYQSQLANRWLVGTGVSLDIVTFYNLVAKFSFSVNHRGETGFFFNIAQEL